MTITRKIGPLLAALQKREPVSNYEMDDIGRFGDSVIFTSAEYHDAVKKTVYDISSVVSDIENHNDYFEVEDRTYHELDKQDIANIQLALKPVTVYELYSEDADNDYVVSQGEYDGAKKGDLGLEFTVHGFDAYLTATVLRIGCQEHTLKGWDQDIDHNLIEDQFGDFGDHNDSDSKLVPLIKAQWIEARPVFEKLQAKLAGKPKKKPAKKKPAKKKAKKAKR